MNLTERYMATQDWPASRKVYSFGFAISGWQLGMWVGSQDLAQLDEPVVHALRSTFLAWFLVTITCCAAAAIAKWRDYPATWLAYVFAVVYAAFIILVIQLGGSTLALTLIPLLTMVFAFCFDERVGATLLVASLLFAALVHVVNLPWLEYRLPMPGSLAEARIEKLLRNLVASLVIVNFLFCAFALSAQRLLEQKMHEANRLIRRYVPAQLADRIAAGGHAEGAKHERRKLTIFFSDVAGFTSQSDELDAEELATLLNEYLGEMTRIADGFGATVNQLIGDGIMIFFGAPTATDDRDHALRAVQMAQAMQRRLVELRAGWFKRGIQRPFHVRIGINTGFASVGDFGSPGRMMYSAIGPQTNLAARIEAHCEPDRILISHSTWALVQDAVPCTPKGEITVKGLHYPVLVYEVA